MVSSANSFSTPSGGREAARARAPVAARRAPPSRPGWSAPGSRPGGRRSAPAGTAAGGPRTSTPAPAPPWRRWAARLRSAAPARAPGPRRPCRPGKRTSAGAPPARGTAPVPCRAARTRPHRCGAAEPSSTSNCRRRCPPRPRSAAGGSAGSPGWPGAWWRGRRARPEPLPPRWPRRPPRLARPPPARAGADRGTGFRPGGRSDGAAARE